MPVEMCGVESARGMPSLRRLLLYYGGGGTLFVEKLPELVLSPRDFWRIFRDM